MLSWKIVPPKKKIHQEVTILKLYFVRFVMSALLVLLNLFLDFFLKTFSFKHIKIRPFSDENSQPERPQTHSQ